MTPNYPKLRHPIDIRHEQIEGKPVLLLRCPIGISEQALGLIPDVLPLVACFNGSLSLTAISERFAEQGATEEIVKQLADLLDQNYFLDTDRYQKKKKEFTAEFQKQQIRPAALAGGAYHAQGEQLIQELHTYLGHADLSVNKNVTGTMIGLVAPHIDYRRGHACYGKSYAHIEREGHDLYLLLGTSHQYSDHIFHLTAKDFDSPLGTMNCDKAFINDLGRAYGQERSFADEYLHKQEHSLELQIPFLKHLKPDAKIAPILIGSFHEYLLSDQAPSAFETYEKLAAALTDLIRARQQSGERICFIAGVDMAHIGRTFGDKRELTEDWMREIHERDQLYLDTILKQDKESLFAHIAEDGDARRICGYPTMYLTIDVLDRLGIKYTAQLFSYDQAVDYRTQCAVTYAGVGLYT